MVVIPVSRRRRRRRRTPGLTAGTVAKRQGRRQPAERWTKESERRGSTGERERGGGKGRVGRDTRATGGSGLGMAASLDAGWDRARTHLFDVLPVVTIVIFIVIVSIRWRNGPGSETPHHHHFHPASSPTSHQSPRPLIVPAPHVPLPSSPPLLTTTTTTAFFSAHLFSTTSGPHLLSHRLPSKTRRIFSCSKAVHCRCCCCRRQGKQG